MEVGTLAGYGIDSQLSTHHTDIVLADGQAKSCSFPMSGRGLLEGAEDALDIFGRNANACVGHAKPESATVGMDSFGTHAECDAA